MRINTWVAVAVIVGVIGGIAGYAISVHGLPMRCFKDHQQALVSPGQQFKAVAYNYHCRKMMLGLDFGPFGWAKTGIEIVTVDTAIAREGLPPPHDVVYKEGRQSEANKEIPPAVRLEWKNATDLFVHHKSDAEPGIGFHASQQFRLFFREEP
jgi:hypothetical protein